MKKLGILEDFFYKHMMTIFIIIAAVNMSIAMAFAKINYVNDNFEYINKTSYFVVVLDDDTKYEKVKTHSNIDQIKKCLYIDDIVVMVGDKNSVDEETIEYVSEKKFNSYEYKDEYFVTLKDWSTYFEMADYFLENNIDHALYLVGDDDPYTYSVYGQA